MKLRIVAVTLTKENIEDTPYKVLRTLPEGIVLQMSSDKPELWTPSEGMKSYRIIVDGKEYEFCKVVEDPNASTKRKPWVDKVEQEAPHLSRYLGRNKNWQKKK